MGSALQVNFEEVLKRVQAAAGSNSVQIVAVSKRQPIEKMVAWEKFCDQNNLTAVFGENYVQELKTKCTSGLLSEHSQFHLIGPLQSNKVKDAVSYADVIQSVHSEKIIDTIIKEAQKQSKQQSVYLQVNISDDGQKSGFSAEALPQLIESCSGSEYLSLDGLMTITKYYENPEDVRPDFQEFSALKEQLGVGASFNLSMGMSADYELAIQEGATHVRVGSALFGERT